MCLCMMCSEADEGSSAGSTVSLSVRAYQRLCLLQLHLYLRQSLLLFEDSLPEGGGGENMCFSALQ